MSLKDAFKDEFFEQLPVGEDLFSDLSDEEVAFGKLMAMVSIRISEEREKLKMSQSEFAEYMGVTQGMVSKWESGESNFSIHRIVNIFEKLGLEVSFSFSPKKKDAEGLVDEYSAFTSSYITDRKKTIESCNEWMLFAS